MSKILAAIVAVLPEALADITKGIQDAEAAGQSAGQKAAAELGDLAKLLQAIGSVL